jgi:hypothetical protein
LFELPSDEELDISVDDICAFPEVKGTSVSVSSSGKGRISSFSSSHGSAGSASEVEEVATESGEHTLNFNDKSLTIPEETDEDIVDVTDQVSAIEINDKPVSFEGNIKHDIFISRFHLKMFFSVYKWTNFPMISHVSANEKQAC